MRSAKLYWAMGVLLLGATWAATAAARADDPAAQQAASVTITLQDTVFVAAQSDPQDNGNSKDEDETDTPKSEQPKQEQDESQPEEADKPKDKEAEKKAPATVTVEAKPFKVTVELAGMVVADEAHEVQLEPESWASFKVLEAVEHGERVREGEVLLRFDPEDIDKSIDDLKSQQELANLAIEKAENEQPLIEKSMELSMKAAERATRINNEDTDHYFNVERPIDEERADRYLKSAQYYYDNALEELKQLEKMYLADDLTEETEEIILKRQRYLVDQAKFTLRTSKLYRDRQKEFSIPRADENYKQSREAAELLLARTQVAQELALNESRFALETAKKKHQRDQEKLDDVVADRAWMEVKAPAAGVVYYGQAVNGKWSQVATTKAKLLPGKTVTPRAVIMTIVDPENVHVELQFEEKQLPDLQDIRDAQVVVPALGSDPIDGRFEEISSVPVADGKFGARVSLRGGARPLAGMNCQVKVVTYQSKNALLVPATAVAHDDWTDEDYVMVVEDEKDPARRVVKLGRKKNSEVEIVDGVSTGDKILKENKKG